MKKLQEDLSHVEYDAELLLLARRDYLPSLVDLVPAELLSGHLLLRSNIPLRPLKTLTSLCFFCHD